MGTLRTSWEQKDLDGFIDGNIRLFENLMRTKGF